VLAGFIGGSLLNYTGSTLRISPLIPLGSHRTRGFLAMALKWEQIKNVRESG
jgi:hypothetical protein